MGYEFRDATPTFEQAGRDLLGATAMRVDAASEVHRRIVARGAFAGVDVAELGSVTRFGE